MPGAMPWKNRWLGNPVLSFIGRLFFKCPAHDFHAGLRGFTQKPRSRKWICRRPAWRLFASEMVIKSTLKGLKISRCPSRCTRMDVRARRTSSRGVTAGGTCDSCYSFSPRWLFLVPGLLLSAAGFVFAAMLSFNDIKIGGATLNVGTLAVAEHDDHCRFPACCLRLFHEGFCNRRGAFAGRPKAGACFRRSSRWKRGWCSDCWFCWLEFSCSRARSGFGNRRISECCRPPKKICGG